MARERGDEIALFVAVQVPPDGDGSDAYLRAARENGATCHRIWTIAPGKFGLAMKADFGAELKL